MIAALGGAGHTLSAISPASPSVWPNLDTATVIQGLRARVRNPTLVYQQSTQFCGPTSIVFELARRSPERYVELAYQLLTTGSCMTNGRTIAATAGLREKPAPVEDGTGIHPADWLVIASLRDDENWFVPIDTGTSWLSGLTTPGEMRQWIMDVLLLPQATWELSWFSGEVDALRMAEAARAAGGVAFLTIDANLIKDGGEDTEEDMWFRRTDFPDDGAGLTGTIRHCKDDGPFCDHWVVYLGDLQLPANADDDSEDPIKLAVWSWGGAYELSGTVEGFTEYMYGVAAGTP